LTKDSTGVWMVNSLHGKSDANRDALEKSLLIKTQKIARIGHWAWNCITNDVIVSDVLLEIFAIQRPEKWDSFKEAILSRVHPDDHERVCKRVADIEKKQQTSPMEYRIMTGDNVCTYVCIFSTEFDYTSDGTCVFVSSIIQDISKRKCAELNQEKLIQEINKAQKIESLGVLASGIAHDFNNLLSGIYGYIEMATDVTKSRSALESLSKAMQTIDRARLITRQLLTFTLDGNPVKNPENIIMVVKNAVQFTLSGSNVTSRFHIPAQQYICDIDKNQIAQVISNIVMNAQQAMSYSGCVDVTIENVMLNNDVYSDIESGEFARIAIKDTGIGIPMEMLPKVFDPFFTTKIKGRGLGLTICYTILRRHGGRIEVSSVPGRGSEFQIYLPLVKCADQLVVRLSTEHQGKGLFYIADDESVVRETLCLMLKSFGYDAEIFSDGREIINALKRSASVAECAGILADLTIPGGIGASELLKELKELDLDIPIFVISGYPDDTVIVSPQQHGFYGSICKPFTRAELSEMLEKLSG
jgi:C4-dicarboxylate-specific signal transduction histidine kinase/CheY-like chemotaxis protein